MKLQYPTHKSPTRSSRRLRNWHRWHRSSNPTSIRKVRKPLVEFVIGCSERLQIVESLKDVNPKKIKIIDAGFSLIREGQCVYGEI